MCNNKLRLKTSTHKVSRPLDLKHNNIDFSHFFLGGGMTVILNLIFRRVG